VIQVGSLLPLLRKKEIHHRLIHGSDYPLPAINAVVSTQQLALLGYIGEEQRAPLNEIYRMNPLLFDFVLKRNLRDPENPENRFPASMFVYHPELGLQN
jgi:mannonate dehydratase